MTAISPDIPDVDAANFFPSPFFYNYYFGSVYSPYFGIGNGLITNGDCIVDEKNKIISIKKSWKKKYRFEISFCSRKKCIQLSII